MQTNKIVNNFAILSETVPLTQLAYEYVFADKTALSVQHMLLLSLPANVVLLNGKLYCKH